MTDAELIEASLRGERDAYGMLVERHHRMVAAVAFAAAGDRALVDDAVQDTFVAAWRQLDRLRDPARLRPWLCGIARNTTRKARRRRRNELPADDLATETTPFDSATERERAREVTAALAGLSPRYREPLVLFYYDGCSVKQVADALAIGEDAALQRLSRGRRQLGELLAGRVEVSLERKRPHAGIVAAVVAALPLLGARTVRASLGASAAGALGAIAARWRIGAAAAVAAALAVVVVHAVDTSERVASARAARVAQAASLPDEPGPRGRERAVAPPTSRPVLPPALSLQPRATSTALTADDVVYGSILPASDDPVETCSRAAHALVLYYLDAAGGQLGSALELGDRQDRWFAPDPAVEQLADAAGARAGEACRGTHWIDSYAHCYATLAEMLAGDVTCSPYDWFES